MQRTAPRHLRGFGGSGVIRVTEADIQAKATPSGGWSRETLTEWGISWPPPKGWKERLLERGIPTKPWIGRATPMVQSEISECYWLTDFPLSEIAEAYGISGHLLKVTEAAGPAMTNIICEACEQPIKLGSRSAVAQLVSDIAQEERYIRRHGKSFRRDIPIACCRACHDRIIDGRNSQPRAEFQQAERRRYELARMPYTDYLRTPEWQTTRQGALRRAKYRCQTCAAGGELHVHHRTYARRGAEWTSDLIVLCAGCHSLFHQNARLAEGGRAA